MSKHLNLLDFNMGYHEKTCLLKQNLSYEFQVGELHLLIGPNGVGKSTLLKSLSQDIAPLAGKVVIHDTELSQLDPRALARTITYLPAQWQAPQHLKVIELMELGRYPHRQGLQKTPPPDMSLDACLKQMGTLHLKYRALQNLSDGERQRVSIARTLYQDPQWLLLDEPTSFLDIPHKLELFIELRNWCKQRQRGALISCHDLEIALRMADVVHLMNDGQFTSGAPEDLILDGTLKQAFQSDAIIFESESLRFMPQLKTCIQIQWQGPAHIATIVNTGLRRLGFDMTLHHCDWKLHYHQESSQPWQVEHLNQPKGCFDDFYQLSKALQIACN